MGMFDEEKLGVPAISLKTVRKGTTLKGTILPIPKVNAKTGAVDLLSYREDPAKDRTGKPKLFPSGDPIMVGQLLLKTDLRDWQYSSPEFEERTSDFPEETDTGLRRFFVESMYVVSAVRAAKKRLRVAPEVGGSFSITVKGLLKGTMKSGEPYTYPDLEVSWSPATPEGKAVVEEYSKTMVLPETASDMGFDQGDEEPPF
jgi:hypothetical protein